jgi:hypothetical protein
VYYGGVIDYYDREDLPVEPAPAVLCMDDALRLLDLQNYRRLVAGCN